jgi:predicted nucleic acid-binding protein
MKQTDAKVFFDTNIVVYLYSATEPDKAQQAQNLVDTHKSLIISTQVLNEFVHVCLRKKTLNFKSLHQAIDELEQSFSIVSVTKSTIVYALRLCEEHKYSYFDSLIIASALEHNCSTLYTEDMHNNHLIQNNLRIANPFNG